jgi:hypothetical protein
MAEFNVGGPFDVPLGQGTHHKYIDEKVAKDFWKENEVIAKLRGCYVLAMRASKGYKPFYVGKATKNFDQEVFADHKLKKISRQLADTKKGTLVLFLVSLKLTKGAVNKVAIDQAETYLIQTALAANDGLLNDRKTKEESWSINGVFKSRQGKPTKSAQELKRALKI